MVNKPKRQGTTAEVAVVGYLKEHGWPYVERRALSGAVDKGDIAGTPGLAWEVKSTTIGLKLGSWLVETAIERLNAQADHGILVVKPPGLGVQRVNRWYAVQHAVDFARLRAQVELNVNTQFHVPNTQRLFVVDSAPEYYSVKDLGPSLHQALKGLAPAEVAALTLRPPGTKERPDLWYRVLTLEHMVRLLHAAGYGDPTPTVGESVPDGQSRGESTYTRSGGTDPVAADL